jgi:hypothetical protein
METAGKNSGRLSDDAMNCAPHQNGTSACDGSLKHIGDWRGAGTEFRARATYLQNAGTAMRARRVEQTALTMFLLGACAMFFMAAYAAIAHA